MFTNIGHKSVDLYVVSIILANSILQIPSIELKVCNILMKFFEFLRTKNTLTLGPGNGQLSNSTSFM